jgi:hypothetical protein
VSPDRFTSYEVKLERDADTATEARRWLESLPISLSQDALLLTHELVVNAVVHTSTQHLWLILLVCPNGVLVQVANEGAGNPHVVTREAYAESGRGLRWVDEMSESWGSQCTKATHVWFQLPNERAFELAEANA